VSGFTPDPGGSGNSPLLVRETTYECQCCPEFESVPCDFSCSRPGEEDASCYRGRGCRLVGGHRMIFRHHAENRGGANPRTVVRLPLY